MKTKTYRSILLIIICLLSVFAFHFSGIDWATATGSETQITTDSNSQMYPAAWGGRVLWEDRRLGNYDIYMYDLSTGVESPLITKPGDQRNVSIYESRAVWQDLRNGNNDIYMWDFTTNTEIPISTAAGNQTRPVIYNDNVVYQDDRNGNSEIYMYNLVTKQETRITVDPATQIYPKIWGTKIIWSDYRNGNRDIYMYDISTGQESPVVVSSFDQYLNFSIYEDKIAFQDNRNGNFDIYLYNLTTGTETTICTAPGDQTMPRIFGNRVTWYDMRNGNNDIYLYDLISGNEQQITTDPNNQSYVTIYRNNIFWTDYRNGSPDIYMYAINDPATPVNGYEYPVTLAPGKQEQPVVYGSRIVWQDQRNGNWDIYMYDITSGTETPIAVGEGDQFSPDIYGDKIVYVDSQEYGNSDVILYDLTTSTATAIAASPNIDAIPSIYQNKVAFISRRTGVYDVYLYDISTGITQQITNDSAFQYYPEIDGDKIVWHDERNRKSDIYGFNLTTQEEFPVVTSTNGVWLLFDLAGDRVIYSDNRNGKYDVYVYDLNTKIEKLICANDYDHRGMKLDGHYAFYADSRNGVSGIYAYDLQTDKEYQVLNTPGDKRHFEVHGNNIAWTDYRYGTEGDIYRWTGDLENSTPPPVITPGSITGKVTGPGGTPLDGVVVEATNGAITGRTWTKSDGTYLIDNLQPGNYKVEFDPTTYFGTEGTRYLTQWYSGKTDFNSADQVVVASGQVNSGIDAVLKADSVQLTGGAGVTSTGTPQFINGQPVTVSATYEPQPASVSLVANDGYHTPYTANLTEVNGQWAHSFIPRDVGLTGKVTITLTPHYPDGGDGLPQQRVIVLIDPSGYIYNAVKGPDWRLPGATVTLEYYDPNAKNWVLMNDEAYPGLMSPVTNPQITGDNGRYGWDVAAGMYRVTVSRPGFADTVSFSVNVPPPVLDLNVGIQPTDSTAPIVNFTGAENGATYAEPVKLVMEAVDAAAGIRHFTYSLDGSVENVIEGSSTTLNIDSVGYHVLTYTAVDHAGNETAGQFSFKINSPPLANAGGPYAGLEGSSVTFNASSSSDPDGDVLQYRWDVNGDGIWDTSWSSGATASSMWKDDWSGKVTLEVCDGIATSKAYADVVINNAAPQLGEMVIPASPVQLGVPVEAKVYFTDPGVNDTQTAVWDWGDGTVSEGIVEGTGLGIAYGSHNYAAGGLYTVAVTIKDKDGGTATVTQQVAVNTPPTIKAEAENLNVNEGETVLNRIIVSDADNDLVDVKASLGMVIANGDGTFTWNYKPLDGPGESQSIKITAFDGHGGEANTIFNLNVINTVPDIGIINAPVVPNLVNTEVAATVDFNDLGIMDTHTAVWDWGDNTTTAGTVSEGEGLGVINGNHVYTSAGVYTVKVTMVDKDGGTGEAIYQYIVIYDPSSGFVTGGGWFNSPSGAYVNDISLIGKASFGFVSKYEKGSTVPTGQTEFQFKVANLSFHSINYDWLVIAGARAQYKGTGTINGSGNFGFMLTAVDGQINGGNESDKLRIKIWDRGNKDAIIYDNQIGVEDNADPSTVLGGGSIVIHKQ